MFKKYNKSRSSSQGDHLITLQPIPHNKLTVDKIFLDDGHDFCPPTELLNLTNCYIL